MPNPFSRINKILLVLLLAISLDGCKAIYNTGFVPIPLQEVSGPVEIGPEWIEIVPPEPLIPYGWSQQFVLGLDENQRTNIEGMELDGKTITLKDGREIQLEAILFDDRGKSYELRISGYGGNIEGISGIWLGLKPGPSEGSGDQKQEYEKPPSDRTYTKLKIKSTIPIKFNRIGWSGSVPK